jgi:glutamyl-tRNA reductase
MTIFCAGLTHREASIELREKFAIGEAELEETLAELRQIEGVEGVVVVSTCNRVEFYASGPTPRQTFHAILAYLTRRSGSVEAPFRMMDSKAGVQHLFRVACGLDSMVLGETEILGQIKLAYQDAARLGATNPPLNKLFQNCFHVAKEVRSQTDITRGATSVGSVAVELAARIFGNLGGRKAMLLGAGDTSERVARSLVSRGVESIVVANRTFERAAAIACDIGGQIVDFSNWSAALDGVDVLICSTSAPQPIVTPEKLASPLRNRNGQPLFIIDLAVPRNVAPAVAGLPDVHLYDMDSIEEIARQSVEIRQAEVRRCEDLIEGHVIDFLEWLHRHPAHLR